LRSQYGLSVTRLASLKLRRQLFGLIADAQSLGGNPLSQLLKLLFDIGHFSRIKAFL
jgi:hypothetical protein